MRTIVLLTLMLSTYIIHAQSEGMKKNTVGVRYGTSVVYSTGMVQFETDAFLLKNKHKIKGHLGMGVWSASLSQKNRGMLSVFGITYLYGNDKHAFEHTASLMSHFDKGLNGQTIVHIATFYRGYIGYRFRFGTSKLYGTIGVGWREFVQCGLFYKLVK